MKKHSVLRGFHSRKVSLRRSADRMVGQRIKSLFNGDHAFRDRIARHAAIRNMAPQGGFTLIELLVVIGIIAILASVVIVAVNPSRQFAMARDTQRTANVATILDALNENMVDNKGNLLCLGAPVPAGTSTATSVPIKSDGGPGDIAACVVPNYIQSLPFDPSSNHSYTDSHTYDTGYSFFRDSVTGRITISAQSEVHPSSSISVTR